MNLQGIRSKAIQAAKGVGKTLGNAGWALEKKIPGASMTVDNSKDPTSAYSMSRRKAISSAKAQPSANVTKADSNKIIK